MTTGARGAKGSATASTRPTNIANGGRDDELAAPLACALPCVIYLTALRLGWRRTAKGFARCHGSGGVKSTTPSASVSSMAWRSTLALG